MPSYDTTATCQEDSYMSLFSTGAIWGTAATVVVRAQSAPANSNARAIMNFRLPPKPVGADKIREVRLVLTTKAKFSTTTRGHTVRSTHPLHKWRQSTVNASQYDTALSWDSLGGDFANIVGYASVSASNGASTTYDITSYGLDWDQNGSVIIHDNWELDPASGTFAFFSTESGASYAYLPHIVVRFDDSAPAAINDLTIVPDTTLSEASYSYRQRPILKWTASNADDFYRYRIRAGSSSTPSAHTHKAFIYSRGSTTYIDDAFISGNTTRYYSIYTEDTRNQSASTNANVSNVASFFKTVGVIGGLFDVITSTLDYSPDFLQEMELKVRKGTPDKKVKVWWGDGGISFTDSVTASGNYFYARHRYTKATQIYAGYPQVQVESVDGFRSPLQNTATTISVASLVPIAKIVASPSRQRTGSTFSFGSINASGSDFGNTVIFDLAHPSGTDGVGLRFRTTATVASGNFSALLWRDEDGRMRCVYADAFTTASSSGTIYRNVNWAIRKGDYVGIQLTTGQLRIGSYSGGSLRYITTSSATGPGLSYPKYRWTTVSGTTDAMQISNGQTNAIHFSSKDSFARGSNRVINRFRWGPNYAGDFQLAGGATYTTGATSSFYWAWTTATTQFMAVRAVDDTNSSSIDVAGVVIETEATFRIPDDLRDVVTNRSSPRSRAYTHMPVLGMDYGVLDIGSIEHRAITVRGHATTKSSTTNEYIDIERISAAFQQRKRIIVNPGESLSTTVQGYIVESPITESADDPVAKDWTAIVAIAT